MGGMVAFHFVRHCHFSIPLFCSSGDSSHFCPCSWRSQAIVLGRMQRFCSCNAVTFFGVIRNVVCVFLYFVMKQFFSFNFFSSLAKSDTFGCDQVRSGPSFNISGAESHLTPFVTLIPSTFVTVRKKTSRSVKCVLSCDWCCRSLILNLDQDEWMITAHYYGQAYVDTPLNVSIELFLPGPRATMKPKWSSINRTVMAYG